MAASPMTPTVPRSTKIGNAIVPKSSRNSESQSISANSSDMANLHSTETDGAPAPRTPGEPYTPVFEVGESLLRLDQRLHEDSRMGAS